MSASKDTDTGAATPPGTNEEAPSAAIETSAMLPEAPQLEMKAIAPAGDALATDAPKPAMEPRLVEAKPPAEAAAMAATPKPIELLKPADIAPAAAALVEPVVAANAAASGGNRFALLAASLALVGAIGVAAGALGASGLASRSPAPVAGSPLVALDLASLQDTIAALRREIAALKSNVDASARNASAQFGKLAERIERSDRAHAEPIAKLSKAVDALQRRTGAAADVTGSVSPRVASAAPVSPPRPAAAAPAPQPPAQPPRAQYVDGWILRGVNRGVAYIQGRTMGVIEVERGDVVPGIGRIDAIRRQEGRWVVVTSRGLIASR
jgi:hypothetical protein